jgi:hypothetical protein
MATTARVPTAEEKAGLLLAISQLNMLVEAFGNAPERVKKSAEEFREALKEWAEGK